MCLQSTMEFVYEFLYDDGAIAKIDAVPVWEAIMNEFKPAITAKDFNDLADMNKPRLLLIPTSANSLISILSSLGSENVKSGIPSASNIVIEVRTQS